MAALAGQLVVRIPKLRRQRPLEGPVFHTIENGRYVMRTIDGREISEEELEAAGEEIILRIGQEAQLVSEDPRVELEPDHDWRSFDEMMNIFECASSEEVWSLIIAWSPSPLPGVRWHCDACRWHEITMSFMHRPTHCGAPMKPEMVQWLQERMDSVIADVAVAVFGSED